MVHAVGSLHPDIGARLRDSGVLAAIERMGIDPATFAEQVGASHHNYHAYRWSAGLGEGFREVVHALPPEEEVGWTPWERWDSAGALRHTCWVAAPSRDHPTWEWRSIDEEDSDERPRFTDTPRDFEAMFGRTRVADAFDVLGIETPTILQGLTDEARRRYNLYRWVVVPHFLADGPVVYAIPPLANAALWPWESWYAEGGNVVHHAHYTSPRSECPHEWYEPSGVPQRPPEVLGRTWYWGDVKAMAPVMADAGSARDSSRSGNHLDGENSPGERGSTVDRR